MELHIFVYKHLRSPLAHLSLNMASTCSWVSFGGECVAVGAADDGLDVGFNVAIGFCVGAAVGSVVGTARRDFATHILPTCSQVLLPWHLLLFLENISQESMHFLRLYLQVFLKLLDLHVRRDFPVQWDGRGATWLGGGVVVSEPPLGWHFFSFVSQLHHLKLRLHFQYDLYPAHEGPASRAAS